LLLLSSCAYSVYVQNDQQGVAGKACETVHFWFAGDSHNLFNTSVGIFKKGYSGLLVIKPETTGSYRIVLITEFGLKIFDMEFFPGGGFQLHYCMEAINKKYIINTLRKDFELLLKEKPSGSSSVLLKERKTGAMVLREKEGGKRFYYYIDGKTGVVTGIMKATPLGKKAKAVFYGIAGNAPDSVILDHYNVNLNIKLDLIDENTRPVDK